MSVDPGDALREWEADKRDAVADARDAAADARDLAAAERDTIADARENLLLARELEARAARLGSVPEGGPAGLETGEAAAARDAAGVERDAREAERTEAKAARDAAALRRSATRRDTMLAAAFAGIAEHLQESRTAEELLTRVAEAAMATISGSIRATVTTDPEAGDKGAADIGGASPAISASERTEASLSFPFDNPATGTSGPLGASLNVFAPDPDAFDQAAEDIGFILAAHATLAARTVGERVRLEQLSEQLGHALLSRDVIGQAKGILMERLNATPDEAFDMLKQSSQLLNVKLREVARNLIETGSIQKDRL